eukprot:31551-Pelagococcus_subviridis.AAC.10
MPQCFSNAVVVITTPSSTPLLETQFSCSSVHMHRNIARRGKNTPGIPPHTTGTAANAFPRGRCGGGVRGAFGGRPGSSCSSSSSAVIASAAYPLTVPRGRSSLIPASTRTMVVSSAGAAADFPFFPDPGARLWQFFTAVDVPHFPLFDFLHAGHLPPPPPPPPPPGCLQ